MFNTRVRKTLTNSHQERVVALRALEIQDSEEQAEVAPLFAQPHQLMVNNSIENRIIIFCHRVVVFFPKLVWGIFNPSEFMPKEVIPEKSHMDRLQEDYARNTVELEEATRALEEWTSRSSLLKDRNRRLSADIRKLQDQES